MKLSFTQDVGETSPAKREAVGALRITADGRKFRYAKAGSAALPAGAMLLANSLGELRLEAEKIRSGAQVSAQMAASALSSVSASAQIGYSESIGQRTNTSTSETTQRSVSTTTANSNGYRESYNHNYNYRMA